MNKMEEFLDNCPSLTGRLARYIYAKLPYKIPEIALASSFALVSALLSKRVYINRTNKTEPCLYVALIAETGTGKTTAMHIIDDLMSCTQVTQGSYGLYMGAPASDTGFVTAINKGKQKFLDWDEFGIALSAISGSTASYHKQILSTAMKLYSNAGKTYRGKEYADKEEDRVDIEGGYLSILGTSTPNRFYSALTPDFIMDGFLPRWLVFDPSDDLQINDTKYSNESLNLVRQDLITEINMVWKWERSGGDLRDISGDSIIKKPLNTKDPLTGTDHIDFLEASFKTRITSSEKNSVERAFWIRANEQFLKVCLCLSEFDGKQSYITSESVQFAHDFILHMVRNAIVVSAKNIKDDKKQRTQDKMRSKILDYIGKHREVSSKDLNRVYKDLGRIEDCRQVLNELINSEILEKIVRTTTKNGREYNTTYYGLL